MSQLTSSNYCFCLLIDTVFVFVTPIGRFKWTDQEVGTVGVYADRFMVLFPLLTTVMARFKRLIFLKCEGAEFLRLWFHFNHCVDSG